jgi:OOP family OmpA-OmpF porin
MDDKSDDKEKLRHRVRLHMYQALAAGAVSSTVLGAISGCQSPSEVQSDSQLQSGSRYPMPLVCDPLPPPRTMANMRFNATANVQFKFGKATLDAYTKARLDQLLKQVGDVRLEVVLVTGHADRIGPAAVNRKISEQRAASVKDYLIAKGIEPARIFTEGKGSQSPTTATRECAGPKSSKVIICLQPDRRVDIEVIGHR